MGDAYNATIAAQPTRYHSIPVMLCCLARSFPPTRELADAPSAIPATSTIRLVGLCLHYLLRYLECLRFLAHMLCQRSATGAGTGLPRRGRDGCRAAVPHRHRGR